MNYVGKTKLIKKHLGFLETEYHMSFVFQTFDDYDGFCGPIDAYSFYNSYGCFTLHNIVQKGEWGWFVSRNFSTNQYELLNREICQSSYVAKKYFLYKSVLKELSKELRRQIDSQNEIFGIRIN